MNAELFHPMAEQDSAEAYVTLSLESDVNNSMVVEDVIHDARTEVLRQVQRKLKMIDPPLVLHPGHPETAVTSVSYVSQLAAMEGAGEHFDAFQCMLAEALFDDNGEVGCVCVCVCVCDTMEDRLKK